MTFELMTINREEILKRINEYIDSHEDKKTFNEELKKIFSINRVLSDLLIEYTRFSLLLFEDEYAKATETTSKIISEIFVSKDIKTDKQIYDYRFNTIKKDNQTKMISTVYIERADKQPDLYTYRIKSIFDKFAELSKNSDEYFYETIINKIDVAYNYAEHYIEQIQKDGIEFDENKFTGELIYSLVGTDANEVLRQYRENNKK